MEPRGTHVCYVRRCKERVPDTKLLCPAHWRLLPEWFQKEVNFRWAGIRQGRSQSVSLYRAARDAAIQYLNEREGQTDVFTLMETDDDPRERTYRMAKQQLQTSAGKPVSVEAKMEEARRNLLASLRATAKEPSQFEEGTIWEPQTDEELFGLVVSCDTVVSSQYGEVYLLKIADEFTGETVGLWGDWEITTAIEGLSIEEGDTVYIRFLGWKETSGGRRMKAYKVGKVNADGEEQLSLPSGEPSDGDPFADQ